MSVEEINQIHSLSQKEALKAKDINGALSALEGFRAADLRTENIVSNFSEEYTK
jgi:hypothetical protein